MDIDLQRLVMATANLPVSIPRGRGRRVVTLYEAQIRRLATGRVYGRASVMEFLRLVQAAAAANPDPASSPPSPEPHAVILDLQDKLEQLQHVAAAGDTTELDRAAANFYDLLLDTIGRKAPR